jgi:glycosyltransferase involved in cell wall biosynthesis
MATVLVVGQTPPPHLGQPIMLEALVKADMPGVTILHVPLRLSRSVQDVGRFRLSKVFLLVPLLFRIVYARIVHRPRILYYAPAGPVRVSVWRDLVILLTTRWMFPRTIFHFHAGGLSELYERLPRWERWLCRRAYFHADAAIHTSPLAPDDGPRMKAKRTYVVPNGIADPAELIAQAPPRNSRAESRPLGILFVAMLCEAKGLLVQIDACGRLAQRGASFVLRVVGQFQDDVFQARVRARVAELKLETKVQFLGVLTGAAKFAAFGEADVFCMPTYYECETFGVVFVEAMACALPVVATCWRGIPAVVDDGVTGFLVEPRAVEPVAERIWQLAGDPQLRARMGAAGREKFLREFTLARHIERMRRAFLEVAGEADPPPTAIRAIKPSDSGAMAVPV